MENISLNKALDKINIKADWIGIRQVKETTSYRIIRDLKPETNNTSIDHGIMIEVLVNGQFGYCGTHDISYDSIQRAAEKASIQAENASKYSICSFTEEVRPKSVGEYMSPYELKDIPLSDLMDTLIESNKILRGSKKIVSAVSMARIVNMDMNFVSSNGSNFKQSFMYVGPGFRVIAQDGKIIQSRSYTDQCQQAGMENFNKEKVISKCTDLCKESVELLSAKECPNEKMDLVLHSDQMLLQIHESIGHALEVDRILGDERNYAGWSFVNLEDFGNLAEEVMSNQPQDDSDGIS